MQRVSEAGVAYARDPCIQPSSMREPVAGGTRTGPIGRFAGPRDQCPAAVAALAGGESGNSISENGRPGWPVGEVAP